ncbi:hypothetical protein D3C74_494520 [compost metagenome]
MLTGDLDNLLQQFFAVYRAGRIVRVNDHNAAGAWRDFADNVVQIREPARLLIAQVMHGLAAGQ